MTGLQTQARALLELRRRLRDGGLLSYVPRLTPGFVAPQHLAPVACLFERVARGEQVRAVVSAPPRHGKTELEMAGVAWLLRQRPALEVGFAGYSAAFSRKKSRRMRELCHRSGVPLDPKAKSVADWRTGVGPGGLWATSVGGSVTGEGFGLLLIDDPVKGRREAESKTKRQDAREWLLSDALTRLHPGGSCIVTQTRWHVDDPAGELLRLGWEHVNLPAIDAEGRALWPERYSVSALEELRRTVGEYNWASLYLGEPYKKGGNLFHECGWYDGDAPTEGVVTIGIDLAYSAKTRSDYSVAVVLRTAPDGTSYVIDVYRAQVSAPDFGKTLASLSRRYSRAQVYWYAGGTEKGVADLLEQTSGVQIRVKAATADKTTRAQATAADYNNTRILLPSGRVSGCPDCDDSDKCDEHPEPAWLDPFVGELVDFTGAPGEKDDQVDALVAARDGARHRFSSDNSVGAAYAPLWALACRQLDESSSLVQAAPRPGFKPN